jgi:hypothetical protein
MSSESSVDSRGRTSAQIAGCRGATRLFRDGTQLPYRLAARRRKIAAGRRVTVIVAQRRRYATR